MGGSLRREQGTCVRVGPVVSPGDTSCHTQVFSQWDVIVMLIKSTSYLMRDGLESHWTSGKGIRSISISFVAEECFGWIPLLQSCWPPRILWFHWPLLRSASHCLSRGPDFPHPVLCGWLHGFLSPICPLVFGLLCLLFTFYLLTLRLYTNLRPLLK